MAERTPAPACKICGGPSAERLQLPADRHPHLEQPVGPLVPYFACGACGFLFSTHLDDPGATSPYDEDYFDSTDLGTAARAMVPSLLVHQAEGWLGRSLSPVLDFGSGRGEAVAHMRSVGIEAFGIDIVPPKVAANFIDVGWLEDVDRHGMVTAIEVFEHLSDPPSAARAIARALKPGGLLALTTEVHHPATLQADWWYLAPGAGHISLFTAKALAALARQSGFHVLMTTPTNHLWIKGPLAPLQLAALRGRILGARAIAKLRRR